METFRCNLISVRLAPVFLFVPTEFLRSGPRRIVQSPIPLAPASEEAIAFFDRFRSAYESGLQFTPSRADHDYLATIVAHELESVQQGCRGAVSCLAQLGIPDLLENGAKSAEELAAQTGAQPDALYRLMRSPAYEGSPSAVAEFGTVSKTEFSSQFCEAEEGIGSFVPPTKNERRVERRHHGVIPMEFFTA